nr:hypothetical protein B0A51_08285 [Rachicladosporium sp. CCFEE 5018]
MSDSVSSPQRKVSRYRSQRQKAQQEQDLNDAPAVPAIPEDEAHDEDGVLRSKSRYRRKNGPGSESRPATASDQDYGALSHRPAAGAVRHSPPTTSQSPLSRVREGQRAESSPVRRVQQRRDGDHARDDSPSVRPGAFDRYHEDEESGSREMLHVRTRSSGRGPVPVSSLARPQLPPSIPSGELFPPPKPPPPTHIDGPPSSSQIKATTSTPMLPSYDDDDDEKGGCFGLFKRKRGVGASSAEKVPIARPVSNEGPQAILAGGGGIVPGTDAPVSAVNTGDRRVLVECGRSKMLFPVTPTTTPVELIKSASIAMSESINVRSAVILESFSTVGIQRPLRRYEHIRDVMNSWDSDKQNSLLLIDPRTGTSEAELSLTEVPKHRPTESTFLMHYSQKVGSWDKRFITLKPDGQITCQKDAEKSRDQVNVCHMSDFDIYSPTIEKIRKKIKPPKKNCFAIKSQEKTAMFESTQNFVHFFCTNDRRTADEFYNAIQGWRSWYLVNVMGEGVKAKPTEEQIHANAVANGYHSAQDTSHNTAHRKMDSMESHYQLGSFRPLVDVDQFNERPATSDGRPVRMGSRSGAPQRHSSTRAKGQHPPLALNRALLADDEPLGNLARRASVDSKRRSMDVGRPDQLDLGDRLGRNYSQRQRNGNASDRQDWTTSHNILNDKGGAPGRSARLSTDGMPNRRASVRQADDLQRRASRRGDNPHRQSVDLERTGSRSGAGAYKPLVDLTPAYKEPPQHANKGRGHRPDAVGPGNLIEAATSPDDPIGAPPSTDWRGRNANNSSPSHTYRPQTSQNTAPQPMKSVHRPAQSTSPEYGAPVTGPAFTGDGLLAGSPQGWGGGSRGRGVMDGSRAKGPLVDLSGEGKFAQGSLLNR